MWYVCKKCDRPKQAAPYDNNMTKPFLCEKCRGGKVVVVQQTTTRIEGFTQAFKAHVVKR